MKMKDIKHQCGIRQWSQRQNTVTRHFSKKLLGLITHQNKGGGGGIYLYEKTIKLYISNYNDNQLHSNVFNIKPSRFFI